MARWSVDINNFYGGLSRKQLVGSSSVNYIPGYNQINQAGTATSVNLFSPFFLTQGLVPTALTNGTQAGAVSDLVRSFLETVASDGFYYSVGVDKFYQSTYDTVTNAGAWPHTIDKAAGTGGDAEDVVEYQGNLYYSYNHSGTAGDIGKFDLSSTFDDDWGSTVPSGAATLQDAPHQMVVGGNDILYIANGQYVASYDGTTLIPQALQLPTSSTVQSIVWLQDSLWIAVRKLDTTSSLYAWNGTTDSWSTEIPFNGSVGAMRVVQGSLVFFYQSFSTSTLHLAGLNGTQINVLIDTDQSAVIPAFYQAVEYKEHLVTLTSSKTIKAYGPFISGSPVRHFHCGYSTHTNVGGIGNPFGTLWVSSTSGSSYEIAQMGNYSTDGLWYSLYFDITESGKNSYIDAIRFNFEKLSTNAHVDWSIADKQSRTLHSDTISFTKLGAQTSVLYELPHIVAESFQIRIDFSSSNAVTPVKLTGIKAYGRSDR